MKCVCGKEFIAKRKTAKFCSTGCRVKNSRSVTITVTRDTFSVTPDDTVSPLSVTPVPNSVTKPDSVTDSVTPCTGCLERDLQIKKLTVRVAFLEKSMERYAIMEKSTKSSYRLGPEFSRL